MNRMGSAIVLMIFIMCTVFYFWSVTDTTPNIIISDPCKIPEYKWEKEEDQYKWDRIRSYCEIITPTAESLGLDPILIASLIFWESAGVQDAISSQGAVGLMQVMPVETAVVYPCFADRPLTSELLDPVFNIKYGSEYLAKLVNAYGGDVREGLFSYGPMYVGYEGYADIILGTVTKVRQQ
jgi:hypothetical protein